MRPRYLVWVSQTQFYLCTTLAVACDRKAMFGGTIYEPLGMTTAEKVAAEPMPPCRECGHAHACHTAQGEGLCLECECMGWEPPLEIDEE